MLRAGQPPRSLEGGEEMKQRFVRYANENNEATRSIDRIEGYNEPTGDIVVNADEIEDIEAFLEEHERETVVIIREHFEESDEGPEEWDYDVYYGGVNCFNVEVTDEELGLSDDELRELIEERTDEQFGGQMGYNGTDFDIVIFEGIQTDEGLDKYPVASIDKILRVIKRRA